MGRAATALRGRPLAPRRLDARPRSGRRPPARRADPGDALGVVLDGLDRQRRVAQALDRAVVEVELADAEAGPRRQRLADDLDLVVLGRDLDAARVEVLDRVVRAVVAEAQAARLGAGGAADDLVAEADPEQRPAVVDRPPARARPGRRAAPDRPGPGERTTPSMSAASDSRTPRRCAGSTRTRAPRRRSARTMFALRPSRRSPTSGPPSPGLDVLGDGRRRDLADEVLVLPARRPPRPRRAPRRDRSSPGAVTIAAQAAVRAQVAGQRARVHAGDRGDRRRRAGARRAGARRRAPRPSRWPTTRPAATAGPTGRRRRAGRSCRSAGRS